MDKALVYMTYGAAAAGALAVFAAMPRGRARSRAAGLVIGAAALGALLMVLHRVIGFGPGGAGSSVNHVAFYVLSFITLGGAARVVTHPRPVYSALYFVMVVLSTAGLAVVAGAEFLAAALVIVYAGAILVTYIFVIMLAQQGALGSAIGPLNYDTNAREPGAAVLAGFVLAATIGGVIAGYEWRSAGRGVAGQTAEVAASQGNTLGIGQVMLTEFAVSVELAGVLLMVAMVGAIALARRRVASDVTTTVQPPGEIGRHVKPFVRS